MSRTSVQEWAGGKSSQLRQHFIGELGETDSVLDKVLNKANGESLEDELTGEKLKVTTERKKALLDTMAQAAYGYNTPAETAEALQTKLNALIGKTKTVPVLDADGNPTRSSRIVNENGSELSDIQQMAIDASTRATRDPSRFGGLDTPPPPPDGT
jgi:hypothetical protein